jgi:hypothetical protein
VNDNDEVARSFELMYLWVVSEGKEGVVDGLCYAIIRRSDCRSYIDYMGRCAQGGTLKDLFYFRVNPREHIQRRVHSTKNMRGNLSSSVTNPTAKDYSRIEKLGIGIRKSKWHCQRSFNRV